MGLTPDTEIIKRIFNLFSGEQLPHRFNKTISWIRKYSINGQGIAVSSRNRLPYPEVTGYFIPTLLQWGERDLARQYAHWLVSIQNIDGSWSDPARTSPYTFDTGQILKGLLALVDMHPEFDEPILKGCRWLAAQTEKSGQITTPDKSCWGLPGGSVVPEAIHLYALEPLMVASQRWGIPAFSAVVDSALEFYARDAQTCSFNTLSHFHAYIAEALVDLGKREAANRIMEEVSSQQRKNGFIPSYPKVKWVCSTGLFQYAVTWYKLGKVDEANRAFRYGISLQNSTGGFYGGYGRGANYFPDEEISWAAKFFLDALWWKIRSSFDNTADSFPEIITKSDGRYQLIADVVRQTAPRTILEAGCGKGRFLRQLQTDFPAIKLSGLDLSEQMLAAIPNNVDPVIGSLLNIPVADSSFNLVFCIEALEHAVNIRGAIRELSRVVSPGGKLVIIDKNRKRLGKLKIAEWEQWFDAPEIAILLQQNEFSVRIEQNLPYDKRDGSDGLFIGWVATKK